MQIFKRFVIRSLFLVASLLLAVAITAWAILNNSLPILDGEVLSADLESAATIERDVAGIPTITASNRRDLSYATGFAHAQDRFFQMDLTRRKAAGELSALFGPIALGLDKQNRFHRFRSRASESLARLSTEELAILDAYAAGVNAGLAQLEARPFGYWLLRESPQPWTPEDSILVGYAMFMELNDERATRDIRRGLAKQALPQQIFDWIYPQGTPWDAPMQGEPRPEMPIPTEDVFDVRTFADVSHTFSEDGEPVIPGSNNWAVAGSLTTNGKAIVANDMHLQITVPNIFYRARLRVTGDRGIDLSGVTLPGIPIIVSGSNGHIAWSNTNSYGDWSDAVIIREGSDPDSYLTPTGERRFTTIEESIEVKGEKAVTLVIQETIWGPVLDDNSDPERKLAASWIAHFPDAINIRQLGLETATNVADAMQMANEFGMPPQNFVVGDAQGSIGWTIAGKIPKRADYDSFLPADWSKNEGWLGWLDASEYPRIMNPESGRIWTANARVVDGESLRLIGDSGYSFGARASQIRNSLMAKDRFEPGDMLEIQIDDRAIFLARWRDLLLETLSDEALSGNTERAQYRDLVEQWIPRATAESTGYRLVRGFRLAVRDRVFEMLAHPVRQRYGEDVELRISNQFESPLWSVLQERPAHLLAANYADWNDLLLQSIDAQIEFLTSNYTGGLEKRTWGERNTAAVRHPLSRSLPYFAKWLDMPAEPLDGDANLPRAQGPSFGASERFGVSPGDEINGYLHMPAGQSGHPLSDFYRTGHADWVNGRPSNFLPGETQHTVILRPSD